MRKILLGLVAVVSVSMVSSSFAATHYKGFYCKRNAQTGETAGIFYCCMQYVSDKPNPHPFWTGAKQTGHGGIQNGDQTCAGVATGKPVKQCDGNSSIVGGNSPTYYCHWAGHASPVYTDDTNIPLCVGDKCPSKAN